MKSILILLFVILPHTASSQNIKHFKHLTINEGLAHTDALCFAQDKNGFIWIGTNSGLNRYDGSNLNLFYNSCDKVNKVYSNRINDLFVDNDLLWLGTEGGLHIFDLRKEEFISPGVCKELIADFLKLNNNLYFHSHDELYQLITDSLFSDFKINRIIDSSEELKTLFSGKQITDITSNGKNRLWVGTTEGVFQFHVENNMLGSATRIPDFGMEDDLMDAPVRAVHYFQNKLWLVSDRILQVFSVADNNQNIRALLKTIDLDELYSSGLYLDESSPHIDLLVDEDENFWATSFSGLMHIENPVSDHPVPYLYSNSQFENFSLSSNQLSALFMDSSACLWIGSWGGGASILDLQQKRFSMLNRNPDRKNHALSGEFVRAIAEDQQGRIWIGTKNKGIDIFFPESGECIPLQLGNITNDDLSSIYIRSVTIVDNVAYIGSMGGFDAIDISKKKIFHISSDDPSDENYISHYIISTAIDKNQNIWCGTWKGGIVKISPLYEGANVIEGLTLKTHGLTSDQINQILYNEKKNEIIASTNKGLNRLILDEESNIDRILHYKSRAEGKGLSSDYIWPFVELNDSTYWLGTFGEGLNKIILQEGADSLNNGNYLSFQYPMKGNTNFNDIEILVQDKEGNLWLGGMGVSKFNPETGEYWHFDIHDGLQSNSFKIGSSCITRDGVIFMGGIKGLNFFNPTDIMKNSVSAKMGMTRFQINGQFIDVGEKINGRVLLNQSLAYTRELTLKYMENDFTLYFGSFHYANPEKCIYRYRLNGEDERWTLINGEHPFASYSNLEYGKYLFELQATNNDGVWSEDTASLDIIIKPPWYRSSLSYFIYSLLLVALFLTLFISFKRWFRMRQNLAVVDREKQHREEMHQMKLTFFTNISHEFKTPLSLILTPTESLLNNDCEEKERKYLLGLIYSNTQRLLRLVNELLEFRRIETGIGSLSLQKQDIVSFSEDVLEQFQHVIKKKNISLEKKFRQKSLEFYFDPVKINKVLFNLLSNAMSFTQENGSIDIEIFKGRRENLSTVYPNFYTVVAEDIKNYKGEFAFFRVVDSGVGISSKSISHIFDRFYQVSGSKSSHLGSGIGLALMKSILLLHKGIIVVSSQRHTGTEFIIGLPLDDSLFTEKDKTAVIHEESSFTDEFKYDRIPDESQESLEERSREEDSSPVILITEDDDDLRSMLVNHFSSQFRVFEAENGEDGLKITRANIPDLIISDIMMPKMDGLEMCRIIKEDMNTSHIPFIFLTAKSSEQSQIEGLESGADAYISKPFSLKLLDVKVEKVLSYLDRIKEKYSSDIFANSRDVARSNKDREFMDKLIVLIEENLNESKDTVTLLCRELGMGRTNLYKKIKSLTGQPLGVFIRGMRLKKAAHILLTEDVSISEVLYRIGINSNSYFTKAFKAQFGVTPSDFIKQNSGKDIE